MELLIPSLPDAGLERLAPPARPRPSAGTYWRTLRHLRWSQLGHLARRRVLPRSLAPARVDAPVGLRRVEGPCPFAEWEPEAARHMLARREFTFLNRTVAANGSIPWDDRRQAKLWLYHLNYFDYLNVALARPQDEALRDAACEIALDWRRHNSQGSETGWEPYPLSLRIVNWLKFLTRHRDPLERRQGGAGLRALLDSLGAQAATLERRVEKDLRGNHLLKNLKALLFAGALLATARSARWWSMGEALLREQLDEQILPDGGHFERSPMYHAQALADLAEIRLLCAATGKRLARAELLAQKISAMAAFLRAVLHPDGGIPLFNDATLDEALPCGEPLTTAGAAEPGPTATEPQVAALAHTGYGVIRNAERRSALIFDCGPLGPDHQPGHGHCDVLSYELSLAARRVVVDTGVSTYEPGTVRAYERSTAAHNTLRIDGEEQAELWASFRVGRRPRAGKLKSGRRGDVLWMSGEHDAYRRRGVVHARTIAFHPPDTWVVADRLRGSGVHQAEAFLHFHSRVHVEEYREAIESAGGMPHRSWKLAFAGETYRLSTLGGGQFALQPGWSCEHFGRREPCTLLCWAWQGAIPAGMIHVFSPLGAPLPRMGADWAGGSLQVAGATIPLP